MIRTSLLFIAAMLLTVISGAAFAQEPGGNLPFTNIYQRPAVSPYTMMGTPGFGAPMQGAGAGGVQMFNPLIYQQLIQPRLEQERQQTTMLRQNRQIGTLQNQVRSIQRDTSMRQIDRSIRPTGHASTFMNTSRYFGGGNTGRGAGVPGGGRR